MTIELINEIAKIKASAGTSGGGAGTQFTDKTLIAKASVSTTSLDTANYPVSTGSQSYMRGFQHSQNQFSIANIPCYQSGTTRTQFYVKPFQVNQTTGALTIGSGNEIWGNTSANTQSTNHWGQAGALIFNWGHHAGPGYGSNVGTCTAYTCSGNSASGSNYMSYNNYWPVHNEEAAVTKSGSTYYFAPSLYNNSSSSYASRVVVSTNSSASSISGQEASTLSTNTSTNYTIPVAPQYGNEAVSLGSLRLYQNGSSVGMVDVLNSSLSTVSTGTQQSVLQTSYSASLLGSGLELSNGNHLYYLNTGAVILRSGNSLTNVTGTADFIPNAINRSFTQIRPVAANTWYIMSDQSPYEISKVEINPTTYKATISKSFLITNYTKSQFEAQGVSYLGFGVTGSTNQYIVLMAANSSGPNATIYVHENPLL
jgi:hypothetical protein